MSSLVWIELDGKAPEHNLKELSRCAKKNVKLCAVVKSNAYGHGVAQMAELLPSTHWFGVNSLEEGLELREIGVKKPVLLLGHVPLKRLDEAVKADLRLTIFNRESILALLKLGKGSKPVNIHLKIETGTARQGILIEDIEDFVGGIKKSESLILEGVSTHFANIEDTLNHEYAENQLLRFHEAIDTLKKLGVDPPIKHTACTAASILFPETHFSMLRAGIGLYGLWPSRETYLSAVSCGKMIPDLKPVLTWKTKIVQIKILSEGSFIGYGCTYKTTRKTNLAILPVGYADGYDRSFGNRAYVLINGRRAPVIGRVCMNHCMIDVTDVQGAGLEDEVVLLGQSGSETVSAEDLAEWAGTINYEIVSRISPYLDRRVV
ncbi:MAG: alanine racemase [Spirochaetota bacterium]|nr:MAG: alanine racemase [Spirochaetota bacterium]